MQIEPSEGTPKINRRGDQAVNIFGRMVCWFQKEKTFYKLRIVIFMRTFFLNR